MNNNKIYFLLLSLIISNINNVVNSQQMNLIKANPPPGMMDGNSQQCNGGVSLVFNADFLVDPNLITITAPANAINMVLSNQNQYSLASQIFYFTFDIASNAQNQPSVVSFTYNAGQFNFPNAITVVCNRVNPSDVVVMNVGSVYYYPELSSMIATLRFNFTFEGFPYFNPSLDLSCTIDSNYHCSMVDIGDQNNIDIYIQLLAGYQSISETISASILYRGNSFGHQPIPLQSIYPWNVTNESNLSFFKRFFPPNGTSYVENFAQLASKVTTIQLISSPVKLKSFLIYNTVDADYYSGLKMMANNVDGATYVGGLFGFATVTSSYLLGSSSTKLLDDISLTKTPFALGGATLFASGMTTALNITLAKSRMNVTNTMTYSLTTDINAQIVVTLKYPSSYEPGLFQYTTEVPIPIEFQGNVNILISVPNSFTYYTQSSNIQGTSQFQIYNVEFVKVSTFTSIFRISVYSNFEIVGFRTNNGNYNMYSSNLDTIAQQMFLKIFNTRGDMITIKSDQIYNSNLNVFPNIPLDYKGKLRVANFDYFVFEKSTMDFSKGEFNNTLYFNFTTPYSQALELLFYITALKVDLSILYPTKYNPKTNLFYIDFSVPSNIVNGPVSYLISNNVDYFYSYSLPIPYITISNSIGSMLDPEIQSIKAFQSTSIRMNGDQSFEVGWNVTILDLYNSFTTVSYEITSNIDSLKRFVNTTKTNSFISGNSTHGIYAVRTPFDINCKSQILTISNVVFSNKYETYFPLLSIIGANDEKELTINLTCLSTPDSIAPVIQKFYITPSVNVYSLNRTIEFSLAVSDNDNGSGISKRHLPYILLLSEDGIQLEITTTININVNNTYATYYGVANMPYGFGFRSIVVSVYGLVDNQLNYASYMSSDLLASNFPYNIVRVSQPRYPIIDSGTSLSSGGGTLGLFGRYFGSKSVFNAMIDYKDGAGFKSTPIDFYSGVFLNLSTLTFPKSIDVKVSTGGLDSNILTIVASDYIPPAPTTTPNVTTTPNTKTCPGNPICNNKGKCNLQTLECECIPKWYGPSCASEIIIIPTPTPQPQPTSETTYVYDSKNITSVVEVIAVRELDDIYNVVNEYQISNWTLTIADPKLITIPTYYYQTQLGNTSTTLNVTIEFFSNQTERQFGGQNISISPSSIKFSISIGRYQFQSKTNYLQVVMGATIQGSDGSCSSKSIGSGNDNNVRWIKMNIDKTSLYGRFITYGIIDGNVELIQNMLIEDEETDSSQTRTTKVGITIPNFDDSVLLDPDFSNLIDVNNDSNENEICKSKKKLSDGAIAGIVVGGVVAVAIVIGLILYLKARSKYIKESKRMSSKLKNMDK
ncbi:hypothetical protein PPL_07454 [Heterostelium album PN500]|uniref:EGF-like domain-containing protein n=1 Tax=Heterostelium pallidum (strain ATCC 26659 / Pp 5 / PN500) TaxID=670386 RepID=D3BG03_HETP5|nr:hypothetical protein PPL_07454 [Heterostelium album PN500]EFA79595.1 hypothetical protein PPL_07454 [Heterostelium album PN500]|eukprot:XP_020431716.1 hypothetical protein PPL_07454 [Heterostelium album PN500]